MCNPNAPDTDDMSEAKGIPNLSDLDELARLELDRSNRDLTDLLSPKAGIAFVGSVDVSASRRLQMSRYGDVKVCFVNPRGGSAEEFSVFKSMLEVPDEVELAVINVNASRVAKVIEECGQRGVKYAVVFSDGFSEVGSMGAALERELREVARKVGVRIIGPNTNDNSFENYPVPKNHRGRRIAMITQSGANGRSVVEGVAMGASFWRWVTAGNEVDLELSDYLHHFVHTEEVGVVALYVEGFRSAPKIRVALEEALLNDKPVVAIKMGSTESGARSAATHTGHLVGSDAVAQGLFRQYGVTRVDDLDELLETANLFSKLPAGTGPRCAMYSVSGGTSALMAENAARFAIPMPVYPNALQKALHKHIQPNLSVANPIDNGGALVGRAPQEVRLEVLDVIASNPDVDIIVIGLNAAYGPLTDPVCADILAWAPTAPKPVVAVWTSVMVDTPGYVDLVASGVPIFRSFKKCMRRALRILVISRGAADRRASIIAGRTAYRPAGGRARTGRRTPFRRRHRPLDRGRDPAGPGSTGTDPRREWGCGRKNRVSGGRQGDVARLSAQDGSRSGSPRCHVENRGGGGGGSAIGQGPLAGPCCQARWDPGARRDPRRRRDARRPVPRRPIRSGLVGWRGRHLCGDA